MEGDQAKSPCPSLLESGREKVCIFLGVSELCAFQVSVIPMRNNSHLLVQLFKSKIDSLHPRRSWFQLHPFHCPAWGAHSQPKRNYLYPECFSRSGILMHSCAAWGKQRMDTTRYNTKWSRVRHRNTPLGSLSLLVEVSRVDATCWRREKQDPFIEALSRKNVSPCQGARMQMTLAAVRIYCSHSIENRNKELCSLQCQGKKNVCVQYIGEMSRNSSP